MYWGNYDALIERARPRAANERTRPVKLDHSLQRKVSVGHLGPMSPLGVPWPDIADRDTLLAYINAVNLVSRWNNIITASETGEEQLRWMRQSGIFAPTVELVFELPDGQRLEYHGLEQAVPFYEQFVDGLTKERLNIAANVELLEVLEDGVRFRFRHFILAGGTVSLSGYNEAIMRRVDGRFTIVRAVIHVVHFDMDHAYE